MSEYRIAIEYRSDDGQRCRTVFSPVMNGFQWTRREQVHENGEWRYRGSEPVTPPRVEITPGGLSSLAGP